MDIWGQNQGARSLLLNGDCEYKNVYTRFSVAPPVGIVASHNGPKFHDGSIAPSPVSSDNYKLPAYSLDPNNIHGSSDVRPQQKRRLTRTLHGIMVYGIPI